MIIQTRKYKLPHRTYIRLGLQNILQEQWWIIAIALSIASLTFVFHKVWIIVLVVIALILYSLFWFIQFYGTTQLEQNQLIFERLSYEINSKQILMQVDTKRGMPIPWDKIKKVRLGKDYFLLILTKTHLIHLPYRIFNSPGEIKFLETILKRKKLVKVTSLPSTEESEVTKHLQKKRPLKSSQKDVHQN